MRVLRFLVTLGLLALLMSSGRASGDGGPEPQLGMDEATIRDALGEPAGVMSAGSVRLLRYADYTLTFKNGALVKIDRHGAAAAADTAAPPDDPQGMPVSDEVRRWVGPIRFRLENDPATREHEALRDQVLRLLAAQDSAALDELGNRISNGCATFTDGTFEFVEMASAPGYAAQHQRDSWEHVGRHLQAWMRQYPDSAAAKLCNVAFDCSYAWAALSEQPGGLANPTVLSMVSNRIRDAEEPLADLEAMHPHNPFYGTYALAAALLQGKAKGEVRALFRREKTAFPGVWTADVAVVHYLLPTMGHAPDGEWQALCNREIPRTGGVGIEAYARVCIDVSPFYPGRMYGMLTLWDSTRAGFEAMVGRYPGSLYYWSEYAFQSIRAGDYNTARRAFQHLNYVADSSVFSTPLVAQYYYRLAQTRR